MEELICPHCGEVQEERESILNFVIEKQCEYCGGMFNYRTIDTEDGLEIQYLG